MWFSWQPAISLTPAGWFLAAAMPLNIPATLGQGNPASPHAPSPSTLCVAQRLPPPHLSGLQIWPATTKSFMTVQAGDKPGAGDTTAGAAWGDTVGWARSRQHGNNAGLAGSCSWQRTKTCPPCPSSQHGGLLCLLAFCKSFKLYP